MSRIISGLAGSIKLKAAAKSTRPTSDRVKESLFAKLENLDVLEGAKVLDLYAGSGALGLEAASRGAAEVILVEKDKRACDVIHENIRLVSRALYDATLITLHQKDVTKFCMNLAGSYSLAFLDPPYDFPVEQVIQDMENLSKHLVTGALVVVERATRGPIIHSPENFETIEFNIYGDTRVTLFRFLGTSLR